MIMSHPDIGYRLFFKVGGLMFTRMGPLTVSELGILPLKVVLRLAREGANNGADDELKEARKFFRNLIEGWDVREFSQQTENRDSDQKQDKEI